jgi:hypothetical protein
MGRSEKILPLEPNTTITCLAREPLYPPAYHRDMELDDGTAWIRKY